MLLSHLTWPEVDALDREIPIVVPFAGLVQGGRHLTVGASLAITEAIVERMATERPEVLFLPTIPLGTTEQHLVFPGTVACSFEAIDEVVRTTVESLARHGFRRFLLLHGNDDSYAAFHLAARRLKANHPNLWIATNCLDRGSHGGEHAVSLALHLCRELVRTDLIQDDGMLETLWGSIRNQDEVSEFGTYSGAAGGMKTASAERGRETFENKVQRLLEDLDTMADDIPLLPHPTCEEAARKE